MFQVPYSASADRYGSMTYRRTGKSGLLLPAVSIGLWHNFGGVDALENGRAMLHRCFDLGITHFDLANNYGPPPGSAEENFGRIFQDDFRAYRDELVLSQRQVTECGTVLTESGDRGNTCFQAWIKA